MITSRRQCRAPIDRAARRALALGLSGRAVDAAVSAAFPDSALRNRWAKAVWFEELARARPLWHRAPPPAAGPGLFDDETREDPSP